MKQRKDIEPYWAELNLNFHITFKQQELLIDFS